MWNSRKHMPQECHPALRPIAELTPNTRLSKANLQAAFCNLLYISRHELNMLIRPMALLRQLLLYKNKTT